MKRKIREHVDRKRLESQFTEFRALWETHIGPLACLDENFRTLKRAVSKHGFDAVYNALLEYFAWNIEFLRSRDPESNPVYFFWKLLDDYLANRGSMLKQLESARPEPRIVKKNARAEPMVFSEADIDKLPLPTRLLQ